VALVSMISYSITDDAGKRSTARVFVPATTSLANIQAFSDEFAALLDDVTGGVIQSAGVTLGLTLPGGLKALPVADSLKQQGANFGFSAANTTYRHTVHVPALNPVLIISGALDVGDPAIGLLTAELYTGDGTTGPTDEYGNDLVASISSELSFRTK
jgi:hypothetical protein